MSTQGQELLIAWGDKTWLSTPKENSACFYFPDFFLQDEKPWFKPANSDRVSIETLRSLLGETEEQSCHFEIPHQELFEQKFNQFRHLNLKKAVPYVFAFSEEVMTKEKLISSLIHLLAYAQENPVFVYGFWEKGQGMLGATPETLFTLEDQKIQTMAVAGTKKCDDQTSLLDDPKELKEHHYVIEGIQSSLKPFGKVKVGTTSVLSLPNLRHLATPIELNGDATFTDLTLALHPTPALGAFPKVEGWKWLKEYEKDLPRGRFGAPVGYWDKNVGKCYVAIRNVQWNQKQLRIGAGCGILKESVLEREWKELKLKIEASRQMLFL